MSGRQRYSGIGNHSDLVGRFFQEHLSYSSGYIVPNTRNPKLKFYLREWAYRDIGVRAHIALPSTKARELQIPKFRAPRATYGSENYGAREGGVVSGCGGRNGFSPVGCASLGGGASDTAAGCCGASIWAGFGGCLRGRAWTTAV